MATSRKDPKGRKLKEGESYRSDGRYQYRYKMECGKKHFVYAATLEQLRKKEDEIKNTQRNDIKINASNITLDDMFELYMSGKGELKQSSRTNYRYMYNNCIKEELGERKITAIKYSDIRSFYSSLMRERKFKPNTLESVNSILHPVFTLAMRDGYIRVNPTDGVMSEIKKSHGWEKSKRHALTIEEQQAFIDYVSQTRKYNRWLTLFTVFLGTGCRVGEIVGLRWEDCDFDNNIISINHNLIYRQQDDGKCEFHITTPKTSAGIRSIPMLKEVKKALLREKKKQFTEGLNQVEIDGYSGFIFMNRAGNVHNPLTVNRAIKNIINAYNKEENLNAQKEKRKPLEIRDFSVHNFRHTFCTRFCENETNLKIIQEIMGHSNIGITMDVYAEATNSKKQEAFSQLEGKIKIC